MNPAPSQHPDDRILRPHNAGMGLMPGSRSVRPGVILSATGIKKAKSWCYIDVANPTVNEALNSSPLYLSSDVDNNFDGTVEGKKAIINFEQAIVLPANAAGYMHEFVFGNVNIAGTTIFSAGGADSSLRATVKMTLITASFVTASQTWNNKGALTLGTVFSFTNYGWAEITNHANNSVLSLTNQVNSLAIPVSQASSRTFYGVILEAKPVNAGAAFSSTSMKYTLAVGSGSFGIKEPYVVPAALQ